VLATIVFFLSENSLFSTGSRDPGKKCFFGGQIRKTVMGFGHPFAMMKNLNDQL
jgi:hypothetical protein